MGGKASDHLGRAPESHQWLGEADGGSNLARASESVTKKVEGSLAVLSWWSPCFSGLLLVAGFPGFSWSWSSGSSWSSWSWSFWSSWSSRCSIAASGFTREGILLQRTDRLLYGCVHSSHFSIGLLQALGPGLREFFLILSLRGIRYKTANFLSS